MRRARVLVVMCATACLAAAPAHATWTKPQRIASFGGGSPALTVDGRGDTVVAWASTRVVKRRYSSAVHVAVRSATGALKTYRVWRRDRAEAFGVSAVIDRRGRITVAWEDWDRTDRLPTRVRAVFGRVGARFSRVQAVSTGGHDIGPTLAVAPDGTVLLVLKTARIRHSQEFFSAAWHRAGHRFGAPRALTGSRDAPIEFQPVHAAFDARGNAYVWGSCNASVFRAPVGSRRFGTPVVLAGQVLGFSVSLRDPGYGLASWVSGHCSTGVMDGDVYGPVNASALQAGVFGKPVTVEPDVQSTGTHAIALPGGDGLVVYDTAMGPTYAARLSTGVFGPPQDVANLVPRAATPAGDLVLADQVSTTGLTRAVVDGDASAAAGQFATVAVPAFGGRAAAALWAVDAPRPEHFRLSVWRP